MKAELTQNYIDQFVLSNKKQIEIFDQDFKHSGSFGIRINYGGKKSYFYNYIIGGYRNRITIGQHPTISLEQARNSASKMAYEVFLGRDPKIEKKILGKASNFNSLVKWFFQLNTGLSANTQREYKRIYKKEIEPYLSTRIPSEINTEDINLLIRKIGTVRNKKTLANRTRSFIHRIFEFAIKQGALRNNPVTSVDGYVVPTKLNQLLDLSEIKNIWQSLEDYNPSIIAIFKVFLLTAQSPSSIQKLEWNNVQLDTLNIPNKLPIPLSSQTIQVIKAMRFPNGKHNYVFGDKGSQHYSSLQRNLKKMILNLNIDKQCNLEILRRSIELQLRRLGINHFVVSYIMQKKTEIERLKGLKALNIEHEAKVALDAWAKVLTSTNKNSKIIQLFPS